MGMGKKHNIVSFVEINPFCQKILKKHWPFIPIVSDIREYKHDGTTIDLLTGGFPCQPFSVAGKRRGKEDNRYLWPEMLRVVSEVHPTWIIGENVAGIINLALDQVLSDLEAEGYACQAFVISACGVDAPHKRNRVWILAYSRCSNGKTRHANRMGNESWRGKKKIALSSSVKNVPNAECIHDDSTRYGTSKDGGKQSTKAEIFRNGCNWLPEPDVDRMADGIPRRMDRLKALGNAIVPQVVAPIMETIKKIMLKTREQEAKANGNNA